MTQPLSPSPTATYRLQLQPDFPFAAAERAVPHLAALGVSHLHLSPVLEAVPGSTHGYDVVDHTAVRAELGGEPGLRALAAAARSHGLGLVVDLVPNHMAVPEPLSLNGPLWQVLRDGPASPYARWFDIDWGAGHGGRLLLPVLGGRIGEEMRHFRVEGEVLRYHGHAFPLRPGTETLPPDRLLDAQWYRLAWWRLARSELNYRRFFTISELIGVRVEDPEVFEATHGTVLRLIREGVIDGLRIDHPDGLVDPGGYLARLHERTGGRWTVVEKILTRDERLPDSWACAGTTGYDALRHIDGLFVCPQGAARLFSHYRDFVTPSPTRAATGRRRCTGPRTRSSPTIWPRRWSGWCGPRRGSAPAPPSRATMRPGRCATPSVSCWCGCRSTVPMPRIRRGPDRTRPCWTRRRRRRVPPSGCPRRRGRWI